ncbi:MAG TPA: TrkA family potassium uptake protein [Acidimicrobiales bacterium]|nr:TrkA family potassium uptake protein [Acidimicrobiales bacterium]
MHVVIVGCGRVGSSLAAALEEDGHTVAIIDKDTRGFARLLSPSFSGRKIVGLGFDRDRLVEAGIEQAGGVAAVTNGDNSNIIVARIARETYGVENVVARIYDPGRAATYQRLGIATVATVNWATDQVMRKLVPTKTRAEWVDATGAVHVVERALPVGWLSRKLSDLDEPGKWRLVMLNRVGVASVPTSGLIGQEGDVLTIAVAVGAMRELEARLAETGRGH